MEKSSFILKGNICYSISKTELKTLSGYVVCKDGNFNADIHSEKYRESFDGAINMELGIYDEALTVYALLLQLFYVRSFIFPPFLFIL